MHAVVMASLMYPPPNVLVDRLRGNLSRVRFAVELPRCTVHGKTVNLNSHGRGNMGMGIVSLEPEIVIAKAENRRYVRIDVHDG